LVLEACMNDLDYSRPIEIGDGVFWVGFNDIESGLHCNPFLIIDGDEAILIDGGSRPDFPQVMMKILKTGIAPKSIVGLIYQHYDPDLCGSLPNLEDLISSPELKIYSTYENHMFIRHYSSASQIVNIRTIDCIFKFKSGRKLRFIQTPFAHAAGSFVTFDEKSGILFTSDLFGSLNKDWQLYQEVGDRCLESNNETACHSNSAECPLTGIYAFHRMNFPSRSVLEYAMQTIENVDFAMIAPQHGSLLDRKTGRAIMHKLASLTGVGIERYLKKQ